MVQEHNSSAHLQSYCKPNCCFFQTPFINNTSCTHTHTHTHTQTGNMAAAQPSARPSSLGEAEEGKQKKKKTGVCAAASREAAESSHQLMCRNPLVSSLHRRPARKFLTSSGDVHGRAVHEGETPANGSTEAVSLPEPWTCTASEPQRVSGSGCSALFCCAGGSDEDFSTRGRLVPVQKLQMKRVCVCLRV